MRSVVQRVTSARVSVENETVGKIGKGLLVLLGIEEGDTDKETEWMVNKVCGLRIFEDEQGKMNHSVVDLGGDLLLISQFTLLGDVRRGMRPSFTRAMEPDKAKVMVDDFARLCSRLLPRVETGSFGANMDVESINQGPVTILLDSYKVF